jgi:PPOX class probable F420-dependent enzyme
MHLDDEVKELLDGPNPCCLSSLTPSGDPHSVVTWCTRDGDRVTVNGAEKALWLRNVRRDPRVSLVVLDAEEILRYVEIRGTVTDIHEDIGLAHQVRQAQIYDGTDDYVWSKRTRFVVTVEPNRVRLYAPAVHPDILAARQKRASQAGD